MTATYFDVDIRTIERYVSENVEEISINGYETLKGKRLKEFLDCVISQDVPDINVGNISNRTPQIAIFGFKAFLNMAMLLTESENAKILRKIMLDIVIDFVNQRTGESTKYINQRDQDFISAFLQEKNLQMLFAITSIWEIVNMPFIQIRYTKAFLKRKQQNTKKYCV